MNIKTLRGVKVTAVRGKREIPVSTFWSKDFESPEIPPGFDLVIEPIIEERKENMWDFLKRGGR